MPVRANFSPLLPVTPLSDPEAGSCPRPPISPGPAAPRMPRSRAGPGPFRPLLPGPFRPLLFEKEVLPFGTAAPTAVRRGGELKRPPCRDIAEGWGGKRNERGLRRKFTIQAASGGKPAFVIFREGRQEEKP